MKYTDKEIWIDVDNYEGIYQISNYGRVKTLDRITISSTGSKIQYEGKMLKPIVNNQGYHKRILTDIGNGRKNLNVHRFVAKKFVHNPNPEVNDIINHIDGDKQNNHHSNLEWCTHLHNVRHAIKTGLRKRSTFQVLSDKDVIEIRRLYDETDLSYSALGRMYNITSPNITLAVTYKSFIDVEPEKKYEYKINKLKGEELDEWLNTKYKSKKLLEIISQDELDEFVHEYCNTTTQLNTLCEKYGIPFRKTKTHIQSLDKVPFDKLKDEIFKKVNDKYAISNMGRVFNLKYKRLSTSSNRTRIDSKDLKMHVAQQFLPNPDNLKNVRIINDEVGVNLDNIEWYTPDRHTNRTLYVDKFLNIRSDVVDDWVNTNLMQKEISQKYNISINSVEGICRGIYKKEEFKHPITKLEAIEIRNKYNNKIRVPDLVKEYNVSMSYIYNVIKNMIWPDEEWVKREIQNNIAKEFKNNKIKTEIERIEALGLPMEKECPECGEVKHSVHEFSKNKVEADGRHRKCKYCLKVYTDNRKSKKFQEKF